MQFGLVDHYSAPIFNLLLTCREAYHEVLRCLPDTLSVREDILSGKSGRYFTIRYNRKRDLLCLEHVSTFMESAKKIVGLPEGLTLPVLGVELGSGIDHAVNDSLDWEPDRDIMAAVRLLKTEKLYLVHPSVTKALRVPIPTMTIDLRTATRAEIKLVMMGVCYEAHGYTSPFVEIEVKCGWRQMERYFRDNSPGALHWYYLGPVDDSDRYRKPSDAGQEAVSAERNGVGGQGNQQGEE